MDRDYIPMCKSFYAATGIPITLMRYRECAGDEYGEITSDILFSALEYASAIPAKKTWATFVLPSDPVFCRLTPDIEYGMLRISGTDLCIAIGPMFSVPATEELVRKYMLDAEVPVAYIERVQEALQSIPIVSHSRYAWLLAFLNMAVNHQGFAIDTLYDVTGQQTEIMLKQAAAERMERMETGMAQYAWRAEQRFYAVVREGNLRRLEDWFSAAAGSFREGRKALSPLRHAKNVFIITVSRIVSLSAIPGGMEAESAYQLMDTYIRECEQMSTVEAVNALRVSMVKDYTIRIGQSQLPEGISAEIAKAVEYIRFHVNMPITVADVAEHIGRSASHTTHRFKEEMGCTIGEYANRRRLEEAENLLRHSDKTLAEIASYLCFSSQPYFQNVFKKRYGVTPMQFRNRSSSRTSKEQSL